MYSVNDDRLLGWWLPLCCLHYYHDYCRSHDRNVRAKPTVYVEQNGIASFLYFRGVIDCGPLVWDLGIDRRGSDLHLFVGYFGGQINQKTEDSPTPAETISLI